jgi:serine/threonine-protein kinase
LHAEPGLPEGLSFADLGSGFGKVFGVPSKPGQYAFDILAKNPAGRTARMAARITISPAPTAVPAIPEAPPASAAGEAAAPAVPAPSPDLRVASLQPAEKAAAFLQRFDGGACFLARPLGGGPDSVAIQGIGSDRATFERLYGDFIRETGIEPVLTVRLIGPAECPAVDLIRAVGSDRGQAPKIDLAGYEVGRGKPLMGTIANLAGRHLDLLLLSNDGKVTRLDTRVQPGGGAATFSAPIVPDAASVGPLQLLIAIAASRPPPTLVGFKSGAAKDVLPRLQDELPAVAGALEVEYFKFAK